jgi:hypothetical protein
MDVPSAQTQQTLRPGFSPNKTSNPKRALLAKQHVERKNISIASAAQSQHTAATHQGRRVTVRHYLARC